ncbi:MAG: RNA ligase [Desulfurococcales archaeon]|nr:RNA ligase [Desulfurococcales archaeon]
MQSVFKIPERYNYVIPERRGTKRLQVEGHQLEKILVEALDINLERARGLLESRSTRVLKYKDEITYIALRRDVAGHYEGTSIIIDRKGNYRVVEGYPHIKRVLLLSKAVPRHFIDYVYVEEKMDGYNVRVIEFNNRILALTRGGYICPYTTGRMEKIYGEKLRNLFDAIGDDSVVVGEVVGMENPYTRYFYPEAPEWDFFVFDIMNPNGEPLPIENRRSLISDMGLKNVPLLARSHKDDWQTIREIVKGLEETGREGIVMKDPYYRVEPLKYTTSYINARDIMEGMKYPFDEGHTFIFPRVLRQMFKAIEEEWSEEELLENAYRIGKAILIPAVESIKRYLSEGRLVEEFTLTFYTHKDLEDFILHSASLGIPLTVISLDKSEEMIKVRMVKPKRTPEYYRRIMKTGISPLD